MKCTVLALALLVSGFAATPEVDKAKAMGSPTAPLVLEVFASFDCPHCREFHENVVPSIVKEYVVTGKAYLVFREFPLSGQYHPYAHDAALYAVAAGRVGKYQQVSEALFRNQAGWATNGKVWDTVAAVLSSEQQKRVQLLSKDPGVVAEVQREYEEGVAAGVNATPTLIVTGGSKRYPIPAQNLNMVFLRSLLDSMTK